jgi:spermidine/putrescine transport system permease protein
MQMNLRQVKNIVVSELTFFKALPAILWQFLFLWVPLIFMTVVSFLVYDGDILQGIGFDSYTKIINLPHLKIIVRSLFMAIFNSVTCLLLAYPMGYAIVFRFKKYKNLALFFLTLPFWINFLVHIYAWFFILEHQGLVNGLLQNIGLLKTPLRLINNWFAIMIVMVYAYAPFLILPVYSSLEKIDPRLLEASMDLGASPIKTFFKIIMPISFNGARLGFFLVFVMSFGEFVIPTLMGGGKDLFVGSLIWQYFLTEQNISLGAAFAVLSGLCLIITLLLINYLSFVLLTKPYQLGSKLSND